MDAWKPVIYPLLKSAGVLAQLVRALACHARGRGFESRTSRHSMNAARFAGLFLFLATIMLPLRGHSCGPIFRIILPTWLASL